MTKGTAIIIGVGPGLGLAIARTFAQAGHPVALLARDAFRLAEHVTALADTGVTVRAFTTDAADGTALRGSIAAAIDELGAPDVLVYNAALMRQDSPTDGDDEGWTTALAVDVLGAKIAAETVIPALRDGKGSILFTGGGFALYPTPDFASMSAGKAALRAYVQTLHAAQSGTDVRVGQVMIAGSIGGPGGFDPASLAESYLELHEQQDDSEWELLRS